MGVLALITKPKLKPIRGYVEVEHDGQRKYKNIKTGEIVEPGAAFPAYNEPSEDNTSEIPDTLPGGED